MMKYDFSYARMETAKIINSDEVTAMNTLHKWFRYDTDRELEKLYNAVLEDGGTTEDVKDIRSSFFWEDDSDEVKLARQLWEFLCDGDPDEFQEHWRGYYEDAEVFAEECFSEWYSIPNAVAPYINYEQVTRDFEASGEFVFEVTEYGTAVFSVL